ncbi:MAG: hypothetical protein JNM69_03330 [Archangium sp.]|nr:hypothetical protein [Archangium sp.]
MGIESTCDALLLVIFCVALFGPYSLRRWRAHRETQASASLASGESLPARVLTLRRAEHGLIVSVAPERSVSDDDALELVLEPMRADHLPEVLPRLIAGRRVRLRHDPGNLTRVVIELSPWNEQMICFATLVRGGER